MVNQEKIQIGEMRSKMVTVDHEFNNRAKEGFSDCAFLSGICPVSGAIKNSTWSNGKTSRLSNRASWPKCGSIARCDTPAARLLARARRQCSPL